MRKLLCVFSESLRVSYVMCGLARDFATPMAAARGALEAAAASGMPVDVRLWFDAPPRSSHPACIAVKAAAEQGDPGAYLRRLREGIHARQRKLDTAEALLQEARAVPGLDIERFRIDLSSHATLEAFGADLERARAVPPAHHEPGTERVTLPSLEFHGIDGHSHGVYGWAPYEQLEAAAIAAGATRTGAPPAGPEEVLRRFGAMAAAEVSAVCDLPGPRAPAELWRLASNWRVRAERAGSGELWTVA